VSSKNEFEGNPSFSIGFWNQPIKRKKYHDFSLMINEAKK